MPLLKHSFVANLKARHPSVASMLSRTYSIGVAQKNRKIAAMSEERSLGEAELFSVLQNGPIAPDRVAQAALDGDVIIARRLLKGIGVEEDFNDFLVSGYNTPLSDIGRVHETLSIEQILECTEKMKSSPKLLALECTILRSLFASEPDLFAELMPNLRPHVPYKAVQEIEAQVEHSIGRGKMSPHGPHKDSWRFHPKNTLNVWVALSDVTKLNGMFVLPESRDYYPQFGDNEIRIGCATYPERQYVTEMKSGDALIFSAELVHGSVLNQEEMTRFAFSMRCSVEEPDFHRNFMYNYVRLTPEFSNLTQQKLFSKNQFEPPSRDKHFTEWGDPAPHLDIVSATNEELIVNVNGEQRTYPRRCPHQNMDLKYGYLDGENLVCPQHQMRVGQKCSGSCKALEAESKAKT